MQVANRRAPDFAAQPGDIDIGRSRSNARHMMNTSPGSPGWLGNPAAIGRTCPVCGEIHRDEGSTLVCYRNLLLTRLRDEEFRAAIRLLPDNGRLVCWCKPAPCHGDILAKAAQAVKNGWQPADAPAHNPRVRKYAGIGSRETPSHVLEVMYGLAMHYAEQGWVLRSGGAVGADDAFEAGCNEASGSKEIFIPGDATPEAIERASEFRPAWDRCSDWAKKAHGRNTMIVLGRAFNDPVRFVVCWTRNASGHGGTGHAIRVARANGIPVFDLGDKKFLAQAMEKLGM